MKNKLLLFLTLLILSCYGKSQNFQIISDTKLVPNDRAENDWFGRSSSISGDFAIVGSERDQEDENGENILNLAGSAYIFQKDANGDWSQAQKLVASDRTAGDSFGYAVYISDDIAIVGAPTDDEDANNENFVNAAGSAYIFRRDANNTWNEAQKIVALDRGAVDRFGSSLSMSENRIIVGASFKDSPEDHNQAGAAYIFELNENDEWVEVSKLVPQVFGTNDQFGASVDIYENYAIVGSARDDESVSESEALSDAGSAHIYERMEDGSWSLIQKITSSDREMNDFFGAAVSVYGDKCLIGAYGDSEDASGENFLFSAGSAYLFERDGSGNWVESQKVVSSARAGGGTFGWSVDLKEKYAAISSSNESSRGAVDIYTVENGQLISKEKYNAQGTSDFLGFAVEISGHTMITCTPREDEDENNTNTLIDAGAAYLVNFNLSPEVIEDIPDQSATEGIEFAFQFSETLFSDFDEDELTYSATVNNSVLPDWLSFEPATRTFSGTPTSSDIGVIEVTIEADDGYDGTASAAFELQVLEFLSEENDILTFVLAEQTGEATIDNETHTINVEVVNSTDVTDLTPTITISNGATIAPENGVSQDFSSSVTYTVTAEDGTTTQDWEVTVTVKAALGLDQATEMSIYPNPATDWLSIESGEEVRVKLMDVEGKAIYMAASRTIKIDMRSVQPGLYLLLIDDGIKLTQQKILKAN